jgi:hypothetical protein
MASRLKRAWIPRATVAAVVVCALPLLASGSAQAALAGANPSTTTNRPDIRSATIADPNANSVDICYDRTLTNVGSTLTLSNIVIGGYRSDNQSPASSAQIDQTNTNCVLAVFGNAGDLNQYTYVEVKADTVQFNSNANSNLDDSVAFTSSTTHNGTTGLTVGPDLVGILTPSGTDINNNTLSFVEDQNVVGPITAGDFFFTDSAGNRCDGTSAASSANVVVVSFTVACTIPGPNNSGPITNAVRGGQDQGAVFASADPVVANTDDEVALPGAPNNGATTRPDLSAVAVNGETVTYTFDQQIATTVATDFFVALSDGIQIPSTSATIIGPDTVIATFPGLSTVNEYAVKASVSRGAVTEPGGVVVGTAGSLPIGGNAGAFARGFTTGPDVFGVVFNQATSQITIDLDQRASSADPLGFAALNAAGNLQANPQPGGVTTNAGDSAGPATITAQFAAGQLSTATQLQVNGVGGTFYAVHGTPFAALDTNLDGSICLAAPANENPNCQDGQNVTQIVSPVASGSILRAAHWSHSKRLSTKALARRRAALLRTDRAEFRALVRRARAAHRK